MSIISETIRLLKYVLYVLAFKTFFLVTATALLATIPLITWLSSGCHYEPGAGAKTVWVKQVIS